MDEHAHDVLGELRELHERLVDCYQLVEELREGPPSGPEVDEALAGLQYSVAKATQDASRIIESMDR